MVFTMPTTAMLSQNIVTLVLVSLGWSPQVIIPATRANNSKYSILGSFSEMKFLAKTLVSTECQKCIQIPKSLMHWHLRRSKCLLMCYICRQLNPPWAYSRRILSHLSKISTRLYRLFEILCPT